MHVKREAETASVQLSVIPSIAGCTAMSATAQLQQGCALGAKASTPFCSSNDVDIKFAQATAPTCVVPATPIHLLVSHQEYV